MTFECNVSGKGLGSTVWAGTALDECKSMDDEIIVLLHNKFEKGAIKMRCNGTITGQSLNVIIGNGSNYNLYTSQLDIIVMYEMIGKVIECLHDDGTSVSLVASTSLNVDTFIVCMHTMNATSIYMGAGEGTMS